MANDDERERVPKNNNKPGDEEKGFIEQGVDAVVDFVKSNTGLSGEAARDIEERKKRNRDAARRNR